MSGNEVGLRYLKIERSLVNFAFRNESFIDKIVQILAESYCKFHFSRYKKKREKERRHDESDAYVRFSYLQEIEYL